MAIRVVPSKFYIHFKPDQAGTETALFYGIDVVKLCKFYQSSTVVNYSHGENAPGLPGTTKE